MYTEINELVDSVRELFLQIKDKSFYNRSIDLNSSDSLSKDFYEGQQSTYFHIMDAIISHIESDEELELKDFGLEDFNPLDILHVLSSKEGDDITGGEGFI